MTASGLHVIFGVGQIGSELATKLVSQGKAVRAVSRRRPNTVPSGVEWRMADLADPEAAVSAAQGADVIYQCLNVPYAQWVTDFPPLQSAAMRAAERADALLVSLENVYAYGSTGGRAMTEDLPLAATGRKGRVRAEMTRELLAASEQERLRIAIGRASDFFGPGVTGSSLGDRVFARAVAGKPADFVGNPDLLHSYSYAPDVAAGLATLGSDPRAIGNIWHLPSSKTVTTREVIDMVATIVGHPVGIRRVTKPMLRVLGLVNPVLRELTEIRYQFEEPFVLDAKKFGSTFGVGDVTELHDALVATIDWYTREAAAR